MTLATYPLEAQKPAKKRGCFYSCHEWTLIMEMFESLLSELGFHFGLGSVFFHLNISRHMWIVVESPKTFLIAIILMVLTSLVRDLQAAEVWQKLPSQVLEVTKNLVAWGVMYETCWFKKSRFQVINLLICSLVQFVFFFCPSTGIESIYFGISWLSSDINKIGSWGDEVNFPTDWLAPHRQPRSLGIVAYLYAGWIPCILYQS